MEITHKPIYCERCGAHIADVATTAKGKDRPSDGAKFSAQSGTWYHDCEKIKSGEAR